MANRRSLILATGTQAPPQIFVDREAEMTAAMAALDEARTDRLRLLFLTGEPGIGKTRLAEEVVRAAVAQGALAFWGRGWSGDGMPPLWPWLQVVRSLAARIDDDMLVQALGAEGRALATAAPEIAARLGLAESPADLHAPDLQFRFFEGVARLLAHVGRHRPLVVVLDDLHWTDVPTLRLLRFLARDRRRIRALVIGTHREAALDDTSPIAAAFGQAASEGCATVIRLEGLSAPSVAEQIAAVCGAPASDDIVAAVHRATDGNPLLVAEAARLLPGHEASGGVPSERFLARVRGVLVTRLRGLSPLARAAVEAGAVLERHFRVGVLRRVLGGGGAGPMASDEALLAALTEATSARLVEPLADQVGEFAFVHDLVRNAAYRQLAPARRAVLHRRAAEALAALSGAHVEAHVATLAYHASEGLAAGGDPETAADWAVRAGRQALAVADHRHAVRHFERGLRALEFADGGDRTALRRAELLLDLGETRARAGHSDANASFRGAVELVRPLLGGPSGGDACAVLARAALAPGADASATRAGADERIALCDEALRATGPGDDPRRVALVARQAALLHQSGASQRSARLAREAVAMAERLADPVALEAALDVHHATLWNEPDVEGRLAVSASVLAVARAADAPTTEHGARIWHAIDLMDLGRIDEADAEIDAAARLAERLREPRYAYAPACLRAARAYMRGHLEESAALAERALEAGERAQVARAPLNYLVALYTIRHEQNQLAALDKVMQRTTRMFDDIPGLPALTALSAVRLGRESEARAALVELVRGGLDAAPRPFNWLSTLHAAAVAASDLGAVEVAGPLYDLLRPHAHRSLVVHFGAVSTGSIWRVCAMLAALVGRDDDAFDHFARALAFDEALAAPPCVLHTRFRWGLALLGRPANAERRRGRAMLDEAARGAEALGMANLATRARAATSGNAVSSAVPVASNVCERSGDVWTLTFEGRTCHVRDAKGLRYLSLLLARPGEQVHCTELVTAANPAPVGDGQAPAELSVRGHLGGAGPVLDARARGEYRSRLAELRAELDEAEANHDVGRAASARTAIDWMVRELSAAAGIGGTPRVAGSHVERARLAVRQRVKATLGQLHAVHPALAAHLDASLRTGVFCCYAPDLDARWEVRSHRG